MSHRARAFEKLLHSGVFAKPLSDGFGIYVHWPFCAAKCPYCDFNSHVRTAIDEDGLDRRHRARAGLDRARARRRPPGRRNHLLRRRHAVADAGRIGRRASSTRSRALWRMANDVEITLEANPASADAARFADYRAAGVNRAVAGRAGAERCGSENAGPPARCARKPRRRWRLAMRNFDRVSLDLIYARPGPERCAWRSELNEALAFGTDHLSLYQLTIEPETPFALLHKNGQLQIPGRRSGGRTLRDDAGTDAKPPACPAYEISNHARPGSESRHNLIYWRYGDYAGVGPGAHGRLIWTASASPPPPIACRNAGAKRSRKTATASPIDARSSDDDAAREHLLMNLRLARRHRSCGLSTRAGARARMPTKIAALIEQGLLQPGWRRAVAPRRAGRLVLNRVIAAAC